MKPVCLVIGAGAGIGGNVAKRFAVEGYHACLCRRSDEEGLNKMVTQIEEAGGSASGQLLNAIEENTIEDLVSDIETNIGPIEIRPEKEGSATPVELLGYQVEFDEPWEGG